MTQKILICEPSGRGGIAHYTYSLAVALHECGEEILLLTDQHYELADRKIPFAVEGVFRRSKTNLPRVVQLAARFRPTIVHLQSATHPAMHAALLWSLGKKCRCPRVVTAHNVTPKGSRAWGRFWSYVLYWTADVVVVHAKVLAEQATMTLGVPSTRMRVIPHGNYSWQAEGLSTDEYPSEPTLLFFGFIRPEKGVDTLLDSLPLVAKRHPNVRLVVAGTPEMDLRPLFAKCNELGISGRVEWKAHYISREEARKLLLTCTAIVLPYRQASQSGVVYLAGAFARPVVATRVGAIQDVVQDGISGILVPPEDPGALGSAIASLLGDSDRVRLYGQALRAHCEAEYSWEAIAEHTRAVYGELAAPIGKSPFEVDRPVK